MAAMGGLMPCLHTVKAPLSIREVAGASVPGSPEVFPFTAGIN